jgi:chaperonin GroES
VTSPAADHPEPATDPTAGTGPQPATPATSATADLAGAASRGLSDTARSSTSTSRTTRASSAKAAQEGLPIRMLNDRILVRVEVSEGERRSSGGILIPATAQVGKRLAWAKVVAVGPNVRAMQQGDKVLFNPEDRYEVEVRGEDYIILRERDIHAVAAERLEESAPGLYL